MTAIFQMPSARHYFDAEHDAFRASLRDFVAREISPFVDHLIGGGSEEIMKYLAARQLGI